MGGCNVVATGHGRYSSVLYAETVSMYMLKLCCEILLLLNIADMDCLLYRSPSKAS